VLRQNRQKRGEDKAAKIERNTVQQLCVKYVAWKTWSVRKENEVAFKWAEMSGRMCDVKVKEFQVKS